MSTFSDGKITIEIGSESEVETFENSVSTHPVEKGNPTIDNLQFVGETWQLQGKLYGDTMTDCNNEYSQLVTWSKAATLLTYRGLVYGSPILIENLSKSYTNDNVLENAIVFTCDIHQIFVVTSSFTKKVVAPAKQVPAKPAAAKPVGTYVTVVRGNTYWGWYVKYGTSIATLRAWNKWADTKIPIGARARVK